MKMSMTISKLFLKETILSIKGHFENDVNLLGKQNGFVKHVVLKGRRMMM